MIDCSGFFLLSSVNLPSIFPFTEDIFPSKSASNHQQGSLSSLTSN